MSSNSFVRVAGIAGILSAVCMVGFMFTVDQTTMTPNSPLFPVLLWVNVLTGIVLTVGLYQFYRQASPTLGLVATAISLLGYLLFAIVSFAWNPENILVSIGDTLIYIVGVSLFSWLGYSTRKMPRILSIVGFLAGLAGLAGYVLRFGAGVETSNPNHPLAGVAGILYLIYFAAVLVWLVWTGISLVSGKTKTAMATA
jgi:hypothetical protein